MRRPEKEIPEDELLDWASAVLGKMDDRYAKALDLQGWMIVNKDDPTRRWPFDSQSFGYPAPDWCEDYGVVWHRQDYGPAPKADMSPTPKRSPRKPPSP